MRDYWVDLRQRVAADGLDTDALARELSGTRSAPKPLALLARMGRFAQRMRASL